LIYHNDGDLIIRKLNQTDQLVLDALGNIGIGTSSPASKLDVTGNIQLTDDDPSLIFFEETNAETRYSKIDIVHKTGLQDPILTAADQKMKFRVSNNTSNGSTHVMTLQGDGNVGIGTDDPDAALHVLWMGLKAMARCWSLIQPALQAGRNRLLGL